jgi:hypothetical protein
MEKEMGIEGDRGKENNGREKERGTGMRKR